MRTNGFPVLVAILALISLHISRNYFHSARISTIIDICYSISGIALGIFIFSYPLSQAYIAGREAASDVNARVTPASPWFYFMSAFKRALSGIWILWLLYLLVRIGIGFVFYKSTYLYFISSIFQMLKAFLLANAFCLLLAPVCRSAWTLNLLVIACWMVFMAPFDMFFYRYFYRHVPLLTIYYVSTALFSLCAVAGGYGYLKNHPEVNWFGFEQEKRRRSGSGLARALVAAIGLLYLYSFFLPAWKGPHNLYQHFGWEAFLHVVTPPDHMHYIQACVGALPPWLANPLLWAGIFMLVTGRYFFAGVLGSLGFLFGLLTLPLFLFYDFDPAEPLAGYFLWLSCPLLLILAAVFCSWQHRRAQNVRI